MIAMTRRVARAERIEPTPETVAQLRIDPLLLLRERGIIDLDQQRAGEEIRDTWEAMIRGVHFGVSWVKRSNWLGEMAAGGVPVGPAEAMYRAVWQPWQKRQGRAVGMVLNVLVDGWPLLMPRTFRRALDDWNGLRGASMPVKRRETRSVCARGRKPYQGGPKRYIRISGL